MPAFLLHWMFVIILAVGGLPSMAQNSAAVTIERQSPTVLVGRLKEPAISFSGALEGEDLARFTLRSGSTVVISAEIDYRLQTVKVRSHAASNGKPVPITVSDLARFQRLLALSAGRVDGSTRLGEAFFSLMNLLSAAPPGRPLHIGAAEGSPQPPVITGAVHRDRPRASEARSTL